MEVDEETGTDQQEESADEHGMDTDDANHPEGDTGSRPSIAGPPTTDDDDMDVAPRETPPSTKESGTGEPQSTPRKRPSKRRRVDTPELSDVDNEEEDSDDDRGTQDDPIDINVCPSIWEPTPVKHFVSPYSLYFGYENNNPLAA
jgi:hypothetical protein